MAGSATGGPLNGMYMGIQYKNGSPVRTQSSSQPKPTSPAQKGLQGAANQFPDTLDTTVSTNPSGTRRTTSAPNLGPQQHVFDLESIAAQQGGQMNLAQQQQGAEAALLNQRAGLSDASFDKRLGLLQGGMAGAAPPQVAGVGGPNADEAGARAAAFARAKEQAGLNANAGITALKQLMAGRGLQGSSIEANAMADVVGGGQSDINDFTREQLIQDLGRSAQVSDRTYAGNVQQRGQDLAYKQALLGLMNSGPLY